MYPEGINPNQHCTYENRNGSADYSFSHTAAYCGRPQPRKCGCVFCYPEDEDDGGMGWSTY